MRIPLFAFAAASIWTPHIHADQNLSTDQQFKTICMSCHKLDRGPDMVAPPLFALKNHYIRVYPGRGEFVDAVSQWLAEPSAERTLMPGAVRRFNLMPPQPLPEEQRTELAAYLFDTDFYEPSWYQQHYEQEHGKRSQGR